MKTVLLILGIFLVLASIISASPYIFDYTELSQYGKGFIIGKVLIFLAGVSLILIGRRMKKTA